MEKAVLRLGLAGFGPRERAAMRGAAATVGTCEWQFVGTEGADAWMVEGACVMAAHGKSVRVMTKDAGGRAAPVVLDAASRPIAFSRPTAIPMAAGSSPTFSTSRPESLAPVLRAFEAGLGTTKACFWTAAHLVAHHATVGKAMFELCAGSEVLAVVDMKGDAAVSPTATEGAFDAAVWKHRARKAVAVPAWFHRVGLEPLMWDYLNRTRLQLLPDRYRECAIYFRRPPRVDPALIGDVHLIISRQLAIGPLTLRELQKTLSLGEDAVARALAAMYYVGSITSNPDRAWRGSVRGALWSRPAELGDEQAPPAHRAPRDAPHSTAPLL